MRQLNEVPAQMMQHTRYTWDASQCVPFESTWSILQKFIGFNACGARDIQREFGLATKRQHPQNWSDRNRNLHDWGALNPDLVQRSLNLTDLHMRTACTVDYVRPDEAKVLASRSLRICPKCIRGGFHTPLHQLVFIRQCPLHKEPLLSICVDCGKPTPSYSLSRQSCCTTRGARLQWGRKPKPSDSNRKTAWNFFGGKTLQWGRRTRKFSNQWRRVWDLLARIR